MGLDGPNHAKKYRSKVLLFNEAFKVVTNANTTTGTYRKSDAKSILAEYLVPNECDFTC